MLLLLVSAKAKQFAQLAGGANNSRRMLRCQRLCHGRLQAMNKLRH